MKKFFFNKCIIFLFFKFFKKIFFIFRKTSIKICPLFFKKKIYINTGLYSKCFFVLPKHNKKILGEFKFSRKLYNSQVAQKQLKR